MTLRRVLTMVAIPVLHLSAAAAMAQTPARLPDEEGVVVTWAIAAGIVVIVCLASFLNPKRSHLS
ncbi:MAG: hypothetical protein J5J06_17275 [Phycisphaerae bacterium]|nr:hypothetical protein [Phycisphaerae bacterium]